MRTPAIALYCLLVCAASWALQFFAIDRFGNLEQPGARAWLAAGMFTPTIVAIGFLLLHPASRRGFKWKPSWALLWTLPIAFLVPTLFAFGVVAIAHLTGFGASGWFTFSGGGVDIGGGPWVLGRGFQDWGMFLVNVAATGAVFAAFNATVALGEELGWRGFLQTPMIERFGTSWGVILLGLIWSFWHLPALLSGYNFPEYPVLGALVLFPIQLVAASFFFAWLTIRAGSFWPAAIAHGAVNSIQEGVTSNIQMIGPRIAEDLTTLALEVIVGLACWWLLARRGARASMDGKRG